MFQTKQIPADHKDLIHDVSYNYHGTRMATCSSDQSVKVWDLEENGEWKCTAGWKTHSGSVWRVTWAHPEFGQVLATCSFDRTVVVWEEIIGESRGRDGNRSSWVKKSLLVDSRTSVADVKFAPKHLGLQLATCSADGIVRIYEAPDVMNLSQWNLQHEIVCKISCSCLSWNSSRRHPPMIAVGSDDNNPSGGGKCQVFELNETTRRWNKVETISVVTDPVHDVAFAPNLGHSYHLLAIASKDLKVVSLTPLVSDSAGGNQGSISKFSMKQVADFQDHESQVWRICWNVLGTILASSGDDGCVRLWKANYLEKWKCIAVLKGDGSQAYQESGQTSSTSHMMPINGAIPGGTVRDFSLDLKYPLILYKESKFEASAEIPLPGIMNIKRNSGWPTFNSKKDEGKTYY